MMKNIKLLTIVSVLVFSSFANAGYITVSAWGMGPGGSGSVNSDGTLNSVTELSTLTVSGNTFTNTTGSSFTDTGWLSTSSYTDDLGISGNYLGNTFTGIFSGDGGYTGTDSNGNTIYSFTSGSFNVYTGNITKYIDSLNSTGSSSLTSILTASVVSGTGAVDFDAASTGNNTAAIDILFSVTDVVQGYFFVEVNGVWWDLYELLKSTNDDTTLAFAYITNSIEYSVPNTVANYLDTLTNGAYYSSALGTDTDNENDLVTQNSGSFAMTTSIPEPGMLSLMGLAFLGLADFQRRRKNNA